jgi:hypothetical protein
LEALSATALDPILADLAVEPLIVRLASAAPGQASAVGSAADRPTLVLLPGEPERRGARRAARRALADAARQRRVSRRCGRRPAAPDADGRRHAARRPGEGPFTALLAWRRADAMGQEQTRAKFDANAAGWNGNPGSPTYGHYRWMRRLVALVARPLAGQRVVDAGCGTGWVGIEAARLGPRRCRSSTAARA